MLKKLSAIFGGGCYLCRGEAAGALCAACEAELPWLPEPRCPRCALPSPGGALCGRCLAAPPRYDATFAALAYDFPGDALVHALKFRGELALAPLLGGFLRDAVPSREIHAANFIVPVPLSGARLAQRGFNQAVELAPAQGVRGG